jgi:flagellar basal body-associated protein FliL
MPPVTENTTGGKKKIIVIAVIVIALLLIVGIFANVMKKDSVKTETLDQTSEQSSVETELIIDEQTTDNLDSIIIEE